MEMFSITNAVVLVIDDTSMMRANHKKMLTTMGISENNITFAENGAEGLASLANLLKMKTKVDLILCDWDMPKVTGIQVLEMMRKVPSSQKIPFLMITGHTKKEDILNALKKGADGYLVKPFKEENFKAKIIESLMIGFVRN